MHEVHWIEFVPTPFPQTPQGNFPDLSLRPAPSQHFITFVLPKLTLSPFPSIPALHLLNLSINSSIRAQDGPGRPRAGPGQAEPKNLTTSTGRAEVRPGRAAGPNLTCY